MTGPLAGPFSDVFDVGGNVGDFAESCRRAWPAARITSFEPIPELAKVNEQRARGRWWVEPVAIGAEAGDATLHVCVNQHSASTMRQPGTVRRELLGIADRFNDIVVPVRRLDNYTVHGDALLIKIDVEGFEWEALAGAGDVLDVAQVVMVEVQQSPDIFAGSAPPAAIDGLLRDHGLFFAGVAGSFATRDGMVLQFDGVWSR